MRRAFTLAELVVVVAIVLIVSGIAFALLGPSRESARQSVCATQLRQWHQALVMYASDHEGTDHIAGLGPFRLIPAATFSDGMLPYLKGDGVRYCPDSTLEIRDRFWHTYTVRLIWFPNERDAEKPPGLRFRGALAEFAEELSTAGDATPVVLCTVHDELYYMPKEQDIDPLLARPFEIQLLINGAIRSGRIGKVRGRFFTATPNSRRRNR